MTQIKTRIECCLEAACLCALLCLPAQAGAVAAASSSEEALRARVEECLSALQQGDWRRVEKYLTKESKPLFRNQTKKPLAAYQIESIKIQADGRTALVVVRIPIASPVVPRPILVPDTSLWRLTNRVWYMELPRPGPHNDSQEALYGMARNVPRSPPAPSFSRDLKFESQWWGFGVVRGNATQIARFPFKNVSAHVVTLADFQLGCDCLTLKTQQKEYKPGEAGTLEIEFDPSKLASGSELAFTQDIIFRTEPGGGYVKLTVGARVAPGPAPPAPP